VAVFSSRARSQTLPVVLAFSRKYFFFPAPMTTPAPILKRALDTKTSPPKRAVSFRCALAGRDKCKGEVTRLTEASVGHDHHPSDQVLVCDAHRLCVTCEMPVEDHLFSVLGSTGVACNRPPTSERDVANACSFYCGGCKAMCPAAVKQELYEDADAQFRCEECAPTCPECGQPSDGELVALVNGTPACQTCADEEAMDDMRDQDEEESTAADDSDGAAESADEAL